MFLKTSYKKFQNMGLKNWFSKTRSKIWVLIWVTKPVSKTGFSPWKMGFQSNEFQIKWSHFLTVILKTGIANSVEKHEFLKTGFLPVHKIWVFENRFLTRLKNPVFTKKKFTRSQNMGLKNWISLTRPIHGFLWVKKLVVKHCFCPWIKVILL